MKEIINLFLFLFICFILFLVFRGLTYKEGMTNGDKSDNMPLSTNGIAGNAASYSASLKAATIKSQDELLISKYRSDYESSIINLDDLLNNLMLKTALTVNADSPNESIEKLAKMQQAKLALNSVMKFVDSQ